MEKSWFERDLGVESDGIDNFLMYRRGKERAEHAWPAFWLGLFMDGEIFYMGNN